MRICLAQLNYHIGNFEENFRKIEAAVNEAITQKADIVVFGELALTGYPPRDFLEFDDFIALSNQYLDKVTALSSNIAIVIGAPTVNPVVEGKDLFNSAYFLAEGQIKYIQHKTLLPTYDIFDEYRYFEPNSEFGIVNYKGKKIALTVCEDIWNIGNENPLYVTCPLDEMKSFSPDLVINVSASPFDHNHAADRLAIVQENAIRYNLPVFYVNHVGAQTEVIFDGGSVVASPNGKVFEEMVYFKEAIKTFDLQSVINHDQEIVQQKNKIALIHDAIITGIKDYFGKLGFTKAILGLSGGIDSAVTCALAARALGPKNVTGLLMPSQFSSDHSVEDARALAENLGMPYEIITIKELFEAFESKLKPIFTDLPFNVTEENIQARCRGILLMAMSNKFGHILLNTSNKSEMAVGYGTLYGDLCGGLSVLGDVYKMDVYALAEYINKDGIVIPENSIQKPPSAELRPDQKDADSLPPYDVLDEILHLYIEERKGPKEIISLGHDEALVSRIVRLVNINEFKRYQTAPALRVSSKAFGMGRRMPIVGKYLS